MVLLRSWRKLIPAAHSRDPAVSMSPAGLSLSVWGLSVVIKRKVKHWFLKMLGGGLPSGLTTLSVSPAEPHQAVLASYS